MVSEWENLRGELVVASGQVWVQCPRRRALLRVTQIVKRSESRGRLVWLAQRVWTQLIPVDAGEKVLRSYRWECEHVEEVAAAELAVEVTGRALQRSCQQSRTGRFAG